MKKPSNAILLLIGIVLAAFLAMFCTIKDLKAKKASYKRVELPLYIKEVKSAYGGYFLTTVSRWGREKIVFVQKPFSDYILCFSDISTPRISYVIYEKNGDFSHATTPKLIVPTNFFK